MKTGRRTTLGVIEKRTVAMLFFFLALILFINAKLVFLQAVEGQKYDDYAKKQRLRKIVLQPVRGNISDRNGNELAISRILKTIFANPYHVKKPALAAEKIAKILEIDEKELYGKLTQKRGFVYIARKIPGEKAKKIEDMKLDGIGFLDEIKRFYPEKELASQLVGFTNIDNVGISGIERQHDKILAGTPGELIFERDAAGNIIPGGTYKKIPAVNGSSVMLTIDTQIQYKLQEELAKAVEEYKAKSGTAVVMDVKTGEILAMANAPYFNLNAKRKNDLWLYKNRTITDVYEPGSTLKTLIAAAALEDNIVQPDETFHLAPTIRVGNKNIKEAHRSTAKSFTFNQIISQSSNIGAITIGLRMGKYSIYNWLKKFGLTQKTGSGLADEQPGFMPRPEDWSATTIGNIPIGQGITVSPLQLLRAVSSIANDGVMVEPRIITAKKGETKKVRVISRDTSKKMKKALEGVVTDGTATSAKVEGYRVAGKTGTAQKARTDAKGYDSGKYVASFIGFAPVENSRIGIIVVLDEPSPIWGGVVAAPVFKAVAGLALPYLGIQPEASL